MKVLTETGTRVKLDVKDRRILTLLSTNCRMPLTRIAKEVQLSRDAVDHRIKRFEEHDVLTAYLTLINAKAIGVQSYHVFLRCKPEEQKEKNLVQYLVGHPHVNAVLRFSGAWDYEVAIMANSLIEFDSILEDILSKAPGIQDYEVLSLLTTYRSSVFPAPLAINEEKQFLKSGQEKVKLDKTDQKLLQIFSDNANVSLVEAGQKLKLSADAVSYRLKKLQEQEVILQFRSAINYTALGYTVHALLFRFSYMDAVKNKKLQGFLKEYPTILWAVKTLGRWNLLCYIIVKDTEELHKTIGEFRSRFGDEIKTYEVFVAYEEYKYTYFPKGIWIA